MRFAHRSSLFASFVVASLGFAACDDDSETPAGAGASGVSSPASGTPTATNGSTGAPSSSANGSSVSSGSGGGGPRGFIHPGILVDTAQLDFVKAQLAADAQPWKSALDRTTTEKAADAQVFGSLDYTPHPVAVIDCEANPTGCSSMIDDAVAAYTHALAFYYSADTSANAHAQKAIEILDAWAATATSSNGNQAKLEEAWAAEMFPRAAEIIRYTYTPGAGDATLDVAAVSALFSGVLEAQIADGSPSSNGNWELAMADGLIAIGVFTDDESTFDAGVAMWRARVPSYIYESSDNGGNGAPVAPPGGLYDTKTKLDCFWLGAGQAVSSCTPSNGFDCCDLPSGFAYVDGMVQETCRDMSHVALGLSSLVNAAETAHIQGVDLYGEQQKRIRDAYEFQAAFDKGYLDTGNWPQAPCGGRPGMYGSPSAQAGDGTGGVGYKLGWEIAYNAFVHRLGLEMPHTLAIITSVVRPSAYKASQQIAWETLTHAAE